MLVCVVIVFGENVLCGKDGMLMMLIIFVLVGGKVLIVIVCVCVCGV